MITFASGRFLLVFIIMIPFASQAQNNSTPAPVTPETVAQSPTATDAAKILSEAFTLYGLESSGARPWHLKATYETLDGQGQMKVNGTYEEFWTGPKRYKRIYSSSSFSQTEYGTDQGIFRSYNPNWPGPAEALVRSGLIHPLPAEGEMANATLESTERRFGDQTLRCIRLSRPLPTNPNAPPLPAFPAYCFSSGTPVLRFSSSYGDAYRTTYSEPTTFQSYYIARDIQVTLHGTPFLNVHLETIEELTAIKESDFVPPSDAMRPTPRRIVISAGVAAGLIVRKVAPDYPVGAKENHRQGTVVLKALIGVDGHVKNLLTISSPDDALSAAAMDAVRRWIYKPYLLNGEPVEVMTQVNVIFRLGS